MNFPKYNFFFIKEIINKWTEFFQSFEVKILNYQTTKYNFVLK